MKNAILSNCILVWVLCLLATQVPVVHAVQKDTAQDYEIRLVLRNIVEGQTITEHKMGIVKLEIALEQDRRADGEPVRPSKQFEDDKLGLKINGEQMPFCIVARGGGYNDKVSFYSKQITLRLGPEPGKKNIQIVFNDLSAEVNVNYLPAGQLEFCWLFDRKALFGNQDYVIRWLGCYLKPETLVLTINGNIVSSEFIMPEYGADLVEGVAQGKLEDGSNTIRIQAIDINGEHREHKITVFFYRNKEIPSGNNFVLRVGAMGIQSGPFYRAKVIGKALKILTTGANHTRYASAPVLLGLGFKGCTLEYDRPVVAEFLAAQKGTASIKIERKNHFGDAAWKEDRTIDVKVVRD